MIRRPPLPVVLLVLLALSSTFRLGAEAPPAGWFPFNPAPDENASDSVTDLRKLNEAFAGEHGFIRARGGQFERSGDGEAVRFWGVNGPPHDSGTPGEYRRAAQRLARYGVNLARLHGPMFDAAGRPDPTKVRRAQELAAALRAEGIYTHFSIYFPLWLTPKPDCDFLHGYDGNQHPFAALLFNPDFQARYRQWWEALLLTPNADGKRLVDDPAVMGLEIQNEDSFFFWTFSEKSLPAPQLEILEHRFALWLEKRHGSLDATLAAWKGQRTPRDQPTAGRIGFRPLWSMANERSLRDQDTAAFLLEIQTGFYRDTIAFLRKLGFKGVITASNWNTADNRVLGPLEKLSYLAGDFVDRHGYFGCGTRGENSEWSVRAGHTWADRSALRFDPEEHGKPRSFNHPAMDTEYDGRPSMISETTWNRPNRYRSEAPLYYAAYGALQGTDAIVHFALDGADWSVKPGYWMQPWTLLAPSQFGQFPAAALMFRKALIQPGAVLAREQLPTASATALTGTRIPLDASFDELRLKDVPAGTIVKPGQVVDPLVHFAGRTQVDFKGEEPALELTDLAPYIDHQAQTVKSTTGELLLDYGRGVLRINAPAAQGASGDLAAAGKITTTDLTLESPLDLIHMMAVALDGEPLRTSHRMLVQVMSEEQTTGWQAADVGEGRRKIVSIGGDPWQVKELAGTVRFNRPDAAGLKFTALDLNGRPTGSAGQGPELKLQPRTLYYLVEDR